VRRSLVSALLVATVFCVPVASSADEVASGQSELLSAIESDDLAGFEAITTTVRFTGMFDPNYGGQAKALTPARFLNLVRGCERNAIEIERYQWEWDCTKYRVLVELTEQNGAMIIESVGIPKNLPTVKAES